MREKYEKHNSQFKQNAYIAQNQETFKSFGTFE